MIDKWQQLRMLVEGTLAHNVHYSHDKLYDRYSYQRVKEWMDMLDEQEKKENPKGFLFTGMPSYDQKAWAKIMEEKGLQGLA